jgi:pseudaminic acid cytidylyltransferase
MKRRLAIIPVRTGSKRLKQKNFKNFHGKPLFHYTVEIALDSGVFDEIHISTESEELAAKCSVFNVAPKFLRPDNLATDSATLQQVCEFVLEEYQQRGSEFDEFCILWATAPMRTIQDILESHQMLSDETDGVISVTDYDLPVFCAQKIGEDNQLDPLFPEMLRLPGSQMPKAVCDNGCLSWVKTDAFWRHRTWLPPKIKGYHMPRHRSVDIDTQEDWDIAEYLYQKHNWTE